MQLEDEAANSEDFGNIEAVRLSHVSLDEIGAIGQNFYGFHYNFGV